MSTELREGCTVEIFGLSAAAEFNECQGTLVRFDAEKGRWGVKLAKNGEVLGVKPGNLKFVKRPDDEDDSDDDGEKLARAKRRFDQVRVKYGLDKEDKSGEIADLLTGRLGGSTVTAEQFAARYSMQEKDARDFLLFIKMAMDFKEKALDPHNAAASELRKAL